jgi:hypothetical protein
VIQLEADDDIRLEETTSDLGLREIKKEKGGSGWCLVGAVGAVGW